MNNLDILETIVDNIDVFIFCKDKHGRYIFSNERFAAAAGLDSKEQIVGKTDGDLVWRDQKEYFQEGDRKAMSGTPLIKVPEIQIQVHGVKEITTSKNVLMKKDGTEEGIIGSFIENTGTTLVKKEGVFDPVKKRISLGERFSNTYLTYKEALVYYYILLGKSNAEISALLTVSVSTVNFHTENLKLKLQCSSRGDLIAVGISSGLTFTVFNFFHKK